MAPPWLSTIDLAIASPRPVPPILVVNRLSKIEPLLVRLDARSAILDEHLEVLRLIAGPDHEQPLPLDSPHRLDGVENQVDDHLLELDAVADDIGPLGVEPGVHPHRRPLGLQRGQGQHLDDRVMGVERRPVGLLLGD